MKKYFLIGGILVLFGGAITYAYILDSRTELATTTTSTSVSSSTEDTAGDDPAVETDESKKEGDETAAEKEQPEIIGSASYTNYDLDTFRSAADEVRVLFFYASDNLPSKTLDTLLKNEIKNFPDDVHIFKVDYKTEKDLVTELSVSQPGTALKYEDVDQLTGIYVANETPDIASFRQILSLQ